MIVAVIAAAAAMAAAAGGGGAPDPTAQARAFAAAPRLPATAPYVSRADAVRWARRRARRIPLPAGGNFNGIRWAEAAEPLWLAEVDLTLQHNAQCQWLRAQADGRDPRAGDVLAVIAAWPLAAAGRSLGPALLPANEAAGRLADCRALHAREIAYATERGLEPST